MLESSLLCASDFCRVRQSQVICFRQGQGSLSGENEKAAVAVAVDVDVDAVDDGSVAWASLAFLRRHAILSRRLVQISWQEDVSVTVRVLPKLEQEKQSEKEDNDEDEDDEDMILELSSLAHMNLIDRSSLSHTRLRNNHGNDLLYGKLSVRSADDIPLAEKVTLRRWRCPPPRGQTLENEEEVTASTTLWPRDQSILHVGGWITRTTVSKEVYYYEVLEVRNAKDEIDKGTTFLTRKDITQYRLEQGPLVYTTCPILPDIASMERLLLRKKENVAPHPNKPDLARAINQWSSTSTSTALSPTECLVHVVGNPAEFYLNEAVQVASNFRQVITVQGLALYAYQAGRQLVASGGLADKLAGLRQALQDARNAAPCILVLPDLDHELCPPGMGQDARLRHDQESRIVSLLLEELRVETNRVSGSRLPTVPAVLVIFSTRRPLSPGPLRQHLVWEPILLSPPSPEYQKWLWEKTLNEAPTGSMLQLLEGRTAREIQGLATQVKLLQEELNDADTETLFEQVCEKEDRLRRISRTGTHVPSVHWSDIGGLAHVRAEIMDAIELPLTHPHLFPKGAGRSGILLFGPPGTGKTLVAKAVATECKLPFLSVKGPELLGSYVGESEANVRNIFQDARDRGSRNTPKACVLFFDEMESLAPKRGEQASGGGNVMDRVVATLFAEMDRNTVDCQTFCIGATNRPDLLDTAMLRPGRFDRLVYLGIQKSDYTKILTAQLRNVKVEGDLELIANAVADILPPTMTGADLSGIVSTALLRATHRLCDKADGQLRNLQQEGKDVTLDEVLRSWTDEESEPVVVLYDLISAANDATPSLTEAELARYENLKHVMNVS